VLSDPAASPLADRAVLAGRRLYSGLDELLALVAADADRAAELLPLIIASGAGAAGRDCAVRAAVAAARRMAAGAALSDTELAGVGASLADRAVRDVLFTAAASDVAAEAEALWTVLARVLPRPWRAEALALLAVSAYVRGDGSLAGTAVLAAPTTPRIRWQGCSTPPCRTRFGPRRSASCCCLPAGAGGGFVARRPGYAIRESAHTRLTVRAQVCSGRYALLGG